MLAPDALAPVRDCPVRIPLDRDPGEPMCPGASRRRRPSRGAGVQRRACHLAVDDGPLLILSDAGRSARAERLRGRPGRPTRLRRLPGSHVGQSVSLGVGARPERTGGLVGGVSERARPGSRAPRPAARSVETWSIGCGSRAPWWSPRERATRCCPSSGWPSPTAPDHRPGCFQGGFRRAASRGRGDPARDAPSMACAAGSLAGLGPGLTPSGDDLPRRLRRRLGSPRRVASARHAPAKSLVTTALVAGASARRLAAQARTGPTTRAGGELLEPMTRFVAVLVAPGVARPRRRRCAARLPQWIRRPEPTGWWAFFSRSGAVLEAATAGSAMVTRGRVRPDAFVDSVALMQVTERVRALPVSARRR